MKVSIPVTNRKEGDAIRHALADPEMHAFAVTIGVLSQLSDRARRRVLTYVADSLAEAEDARSRPEATRTVDAGLPLDDGHPVAIRMR